MKDKTETLTIFRTFKDGGETIAMFPLIPASRDGWNCGSYLHVGQHGEATPFLCRGGRDCPTRPATRAEIKPLAAELRRIGYKLKIGKRFPRNAYEQRKAALAGL